MLRSQNLRSLVALALSSGFATSRAQGLFERQGVRLVADVVAEDLKRPSAMVFLPDGRALLLGSRFEITRDGRRDSIVA